MQLPTATLPWLLRIHRAAEATPYYDIDGYMRRNWVLGARSPHRNDDNPNWDGQRGGVLYTAITRLVAIRAHDVLRSDNDRHLHDHPCASLSIVLEGGYWEVTRHPESEQNLPLVRQEILGRIALLDHCSPDRELIKAARGIGVYWRGPGAVRKAREQQRYPRSPSEEDRLRDEVWADADKERNRDAAQLAREFGPRWSGPAP